MMEQLTKDDINKLVRPQYRLTDKDVEEMKEFWEKLLRLEE